MMLKTGFKFWDVVGAVLEYMEDIFDWMLNFYPFDDVPIPLFYFLVGIATVSLVFEFFPTWSTGSLDVDSDDERNHNLADLQSPWGFDYDDDDF